MSARPATPPTTPPAIAPASLLEDELAAAPLGDEDELELAEEVAVALEDEAAGELDSTS